MAHDPLIWSEARQKLPLPELMAAIGDKEFAQKNALCPFCLAAGRNPKRGKWGVYEKAGRYFFKCYKTECEANDPEGGASEVGYLMARKGLSLKDASTEYLIRAVPEMVPHLLTKPGDKVPKGRPVIAEPPDEEPELPPPANPWEALHRKLPLTTPDRDKLMAQRGFSAETITLNGLRSNNQACKPLVKSLEEDVERHAAHRGRHLQGGRPPAARPERAVLRVRHHGREG